MPASCWLFLSFLFLSMNTSAKVYPSNGFEFEVKPTPNWVISPDYATPNESSNSVSYLLVDQQYRVAGKDSQVYKHYIEQANNLDGIEQSAKLNIGFNPEYQRLILHKVDIIRQGETLNKLTPEKVRLVREETELSQAIFTGYVSGLLFIEDMRVGDIIDYSYSIVGRNPVYEDHYFWSFHTSWTVPVGHLYNRILSPSDRPLNIHNHGENEAPIISKNDNEVRVSTVNGDWTSYTWSVKQTPTYYNEDDYPTGFDPSRYVSVSDFPNWLSVNKWANTLYDYQFTSPELIKEVDILAGMGKEKSLVEALKFVQNNIRYLGIELGMNSHRPHAPDEVMKNRYGDCKDKAQLLIALLKQLEIEAYPALVSWEFNAINLSLRR